MMQTPSIRFGAAKVDIDPTGLTRFKNKPEKYMKYRAQFNRLEALKDGDKARWTAMSNNTTIEIGGHYYYKEDPYSYRPVRDYFRMATLADITTKDERTHETVTSRLEKRRTETVSGFWGRVLRMADKMDRTLAPQAREQARKQEPASQDGHRDRRYIVQD